MGGGDRRRRSKAARSRCTSRTAHYTGAADLDRLLSQN